MKKIVYLLLFLPFLAQSQIDSLVIEDQDFEYIIIEGDSIPHTTIDLDEVLLLHKLKFDSKEDRKRYLILRRKTIKVYPYAKLAAERLESLNERIDHIKKKSDQKKYAKMIQTYIEDEFAEELKQLTRTEGQILVKLIYRQTGETTFDLIKRLRSGWRAFWFNSTANLFNISLKEVYDPENVKEDYLIEDILQRNFQSGLLERQDSVIKFDFLELTEKWLK
ncbi:DUF4294 domain-containing protein [Formosa maritima]|uniref:DUF4294 domain-containing protein n=1 Tax=Formosa maritima TaxID=2592046 RepID=A0A5D0GCC4_9FLAO|nr:DUF4294 domain-containing protein [Formosa maritima]TYA56320.1 DUF4294 domain-containing protein [Formosa maritima]